jgi:uncharacterized protein (UPF0276 family)
MRELTMHDSVGLGWRGELAAGILERLDAIDVLEVIAEDWMKKPRAEQRALRTLGESCPVMLHGVAMGLASSIAVERERVDRMARLVDVVRPSMWSEHLAFVRAGGHEVGHLAAPPRTGETIEGACKNIALATRIVGSAPALENIATLVDPPLATLGEAAWTRAILGYSLAPMLLDLHNLYANALNFGTEPRALLAAMPLDQIEVVHLSGGHWITHDGETRLLDDHVHDPPDPVYDLLEELASTTSRPLTVIIERDGRYPSMDELVAQMDRARAALRRGRACRPRVVGGPMHWMPTGAGMTI